MSVIRDAAWLDVQSFPEPEWVVKGVIPEGCAILTGHPKVGKSFLVLDIALAAASGGEVLGIEVGQRPVLYLALEDFDRRIQERAWQLNDGPPLPIAFSYLTRQHLAVAVDEALGWLDRHRDDKPLVIVDTLEKIRPKRGSSAYQSDYEAGNELQRLLAPSGAVIAVHHNRKDVSSEDFLDDVSGTLGLTGSVDTILSLKRQRTGTEGTLSVTGRDIDESIYQLTFSDAGRWIANASDLRDAADKADRLRLSASMRKVIDAVDQWKSISAPEVAVVCEIPEPTARQYLSRLCKSGLVSRLSQGVYGPVTPSQVSHDKPDHIESAA